jgi:hypothetical protein
VKLTIRSEDELITLRNAIEAFKSEALAEALANTDEVMLHEVAICERLLERIETEIEEQAICV